MLPFLTTPPNSLWVGWRPCSGQVWGQNSTSLFDVATELRQPPVEYYMLRAEVLCQGFEAWGLRCRVRRQQGACRGGGRWT